MGDGQEVRPSTWDRSTVALLLSVFTGAAAALAGVTVLGKQVYDLTGRELDLGLLGLAEFAPAALLVLVTGTLADRWDRRRITAVAVLLEGVVALALAWYASTSPTAVAPIFALVLAFGVARAFAAPAIRALPADVVAPDRVPFIIPRVSAAWQAAVVVGPVLGGSLYVVDPALPFLAMAVLCVVSAVAVLSVEVRAPAIAAAPALVRETVLDPVGVAETTAPSPAPLAPSSRAGLGEALEGLRFIRHHPILLGAISLDLFAVLFGGAVALLPAIAEDRLGVGAVGLGWLRAAAGMGAALVTVGLAVRPLNARVGRTLLVVVAAFGALTIVLGVTRSYLVAFLALAALSGADAISVFIRATLVPLVTPEGRRGRVLAVENVFIGASNELGAFESGVAGQLLGTGPAVVLGGAATLVVAAGWWVFFPALRDVDRFPANVAGADAVPESASA